VFVTYVDDRIGEVQVYKYIRTRACFL